MKGYRITLTALMVITTAVPSLPAPTFEKITSLPGLPHPPPFQQYSGYLQVSDTKQLFYWFVQSYGDPQKDPLVVWLQGGPGCSSLLGLLQENGPFSLQEDGASLKYNPYSWNKLANMLYLEAPAGVGYSYNTNGTYAIDDDTTARDNYQALKSFFKKFPEMKSNSFYLTGESYAGIYVPTLMDIVLKDSSINFKGIAIGNGLFSYPMAVNARLYTAFYHGLFGTREWNSLLKICCPDSHDITEVCDTYNQGKTNPECASQRDKLRESIFNGELDEYNIYAECAGGVKKKPTPSATLKYTTQFMDESLITKYNPETCENSTSIRKYLNQAAVRKAIHVNSHSSVWASCSAKVGASYKNLYKNVTVFIKTAMRKGLRILIYNGDVDIACPFLLAEWFVNSLQDKQEQETRAWYYMAADGTKQIAGYVTKFKHLTRVTVRGSGHMVPKDKPIEAFQMFANYILDKPF